MKNRFAFSLIEAMIILIMISVAVMLLIPLITKKTDFPRWVPLKDDDGEVQALGYGENNFQRVGVDADPYDGRTAITFGSGSDARTYYPRLAVKNLAFFNDGEMANEGIFLGAFSEGTRGGYGTAAFKYLQRDNFYPADSIVLGVNPTVNAANNATNSIVIRSFAEPKDKFKYTNAISIGNTQDAQASAATDGNIYYKEDTGRLVLRGFGAGAGLTGEKIVEVEPDSLSINYAYHPNVLGKVGAEYEDAKKGIFSGGTVTEVEQLIKISDGVIDIGADIYLGVCTKSECATNKVDNYNNGTLTIGNDFTDLGVGPDTAVTCTCKQISCNVTPTTAADGTTTYSYSWKQTTEKTEDYVVGSSPEYDNNFTKFKSENSCNSSSQSSNIGKSCKCTCRDEDGGIPRYCYCLGYKSLSTATNSNLVTPFIQGTDGKTYCKNTEQNASTPTIPDTSKGKRFWGIFSDKRLKNIISKYEKGFDELSKIDTYLFTFKNDPKKRVRSGIIAQKLIGVFDEALLKDADGFYNYDKSSLLYAMVNSVKEFFNKQLELTKKQKKLNKKADKLLRMYE